MTHFNSKAIPTNHTDYNCHIKAVKLVQPIMWGPYTPPVINSLGEEADRDIHTHTHALTYMHACMHPPTHAYTHPHTPTHPHRYMLPCTHTHTDAHTIMLSIIKITLIKH